MRRMSVGLLKKPVKNITANTGKNGNIVAVNFGSFSEGGAYAVAA